MFPVVVGLIGGSWTLAEFPWCCSWQSCSWPGGIRLLPWRTRRSPALCLYDVVVLRTEHRLNQAMGGSTPAHMPIAVVRQVHWMGHYATADLSLLFFWSAVQCNKCRSQGQGEPFAGMAQVGVQPVLCYFAKILPGAIKRVAQRQHGNVPVGHHFVL